MLLFIKKLVVYTTTESEMKKRIHVLYYVWSWYSRGDRVWSSQNSDSLSVWPVHRTSSRIIISSACSTQIYLKTEDKL